jgi:phage terminase large subunit
MENNIVNIPIEYKGLFDKSWREAAIYGGRFSLKSHTVARYLLIRARQEKTRVGCFREFQNSIAESSHQLLADLIKQYGLTDFQVTNNSIINKITGSDFIFKGLYLNEQSIKSIEGIDIAWVEEAQTITKQSIEILTPTVRKAGSQIIYTYNRLLEDDPVHQRLVTEGRPNTLIINVNYDIALKYGMMPDVIKAEMEDDRDKRPSLYKHKWLGEPSSTERKIYRDWAIIDEIPHEARLERYGLDYGYSNDPTSIVAVYKYNGGYIWDEIIYKKGLSNKQIADVLLNLPEALVIPDSAEPKSNDELISYGISVLPSQKGQGSVNQGIQLVQSQRVSVTRRSQNIIREYQNYLWRVDNNDRIINVPEGGFEHALDAGRYAMETLNVDTEMSAIEKYLLMQRERNNGTNFSR